MRTLAVEIVAVSLLAALGGCRTGGGAGTVAELAPAVGPAVAIAASDLPGNWGLASFRAEADRPRTEAEAKTACGNPYKIEPGANGGVMMHLVDQSTPTEVFVKTDPQGRVFIGPTGPPAVQQDRMVVSFENGVLVAEWLDASARERYGTMVFVRCAAA